MQQARTLADFENETPNVRRRRRAHSPPVFFGKHSQLCPRGPAARLPHVGQDDPGRPQSFLVAASSSSEAVEAVQEDDEGAVVGLFDAVGSFQFLLPRHDKVVLGHGRLAVIVVVRKDD